MNFPPRYVLFDLDGTLVDPAGAITGGIRHALLSSGIPDPGQELLDTLVGPPLAHGLMTVPGMTEDQLPAVIRDYRYEYLRHGIFEGHPYPGIPGLLDGLRAAGIALAVATSKPEHIALALLEAQGLLDRFDAVRGATAAEQDSLAEGPGKGHIVRTALEALAADPEAAVMVGDRHYDVQGAAVCGLECIGVSWGFALPGELEAAGAAAIVDSAHELEEILFGGLRGTPVPDTKGKAE
ncbi:HAD hydrolase-like protein [Zafaria cholistanensis]|uniref:HAD hydrolase-like protein n=1 Tax=Zafaria cholistanensis TaxID=1682741 RepID=UPI001CED6189|nr:HAD hydrolase-like protein [Zafaria cholistanensis]